MGIILGLAGYSQLFIPGFPLQKKSPAKFTNFPLGAHFYFPGKNNFGWIIPGQRGGFSISGNFLLTWLFLPLEPRVLLYIL